MSANPASPRSSHRWRWALAAVLGLPAAGAAWVVPEVGLAMLMGAVLGAAWRRSMLLKVVGALALVIALGAAALLSYLPDAAAMREEVTRRFEVPRGRVSPDRFGYSGRIEWADCLSQHRREDELSLSYEVADALDERRRNKGSPGLEQILASQLPGAMRVVRDWRDVKVGRSRRDAALMSYLSANTLRWPLPVATRWVGAVRVPAIRRSERLVLPAEDAVIELRAPARCIATTFPRPVTVERGSDTDRFVVPVGRQASSLHTVTHLGQDPYTVSLSVIDASARTTAMVPVVDLLVHWTATGAALVIGLVAAVLLIPRFR